MDMKYELYQIGGHVRDSIIGVPSKDIDYTVVVDNNGGFFCDEISGCRDITKYDTPEAAFNDFVEEIKSQGYEVFLETPECLTVRARMPHTKEVADFVIARQETYIPESRTPTATLGTLYDDVMRRDFTLNAIAKDVDGNIIDLVGGVRDLRLGILRTPIDSVLSLNDDPLRIFRAVRFQVTRGFDFSDALIAAMRHYPLDRLKLISEERIREELYKCFAHDSRKTMKVLNDLDRSGCYLLNWVLRNTSIWLNPTLKK